MITRQTVHTITVIDGAAGDYRGYADQPFQIDQVIERVTTSSNGPARYSVRVSGPAISPDGGLSAYHLHKEIVVEDLSELPERLAACLMGPVHLRGVPQL